ncbi:MAG: GTP-binding protein [Gloeocapsa sp. DLM2.Bin57]|nr:MAG: GTP-binding protein [Gloeocapsa sp. DLM2.Bin57]
MNNPQEILAQALNWAENSPDSTRTIIEWSDRRYGLNKFWNSVHWLRKASESFQRPLRIAICGENNSGKSTLVNALIRDEIAVTDFFEFTFCPMVFSYEYKEQVKIIYNSDAVIEVNLADLEAKMRSLHAEKELENIKRIEVKAPKRYLKKYQIADVPGLGADERNTRIAQAFTEEIDVVIFVLNATILGQLSIMQEIEKLTEQFSHICLVINKMDQVGYENDEETVEFIASQIYELRKIPIFPMAALDVANNATAQEWLHDLEEQFFKPVAENAESIKVIQALEKCYRQLSTLSIFLQSTYHQANRYSTLVKVSSKRLEKAIDSLLDNLDKEVKRWVEQEGFLSLIKEYKLRLEKNNIKSESKARKELEQLLVEVSIQQEVQNLLKVIKDFIQSEIARAEAKINEMQNDIFSPFKIEQTVRILQNKSENPSKNITVNPNSGEIRERKGYESNPSDSSQLTNNNLLVAGSLLTAGLTIFEVVVETAFLPAVTGGIALIIPVMKLVSNWDQIASWLANNQDINNQKLDEDLNEIRIKLAQAVVNQVFPNGAKQVIAPSIREQFQQWEEKNYDTLWNPLAKISQNLSDLAEYIRQGEEIRTTALETLTEKSQSRGDLLSNQNFGKLSPAAAKALDIFDSPINYRVEQTDALRAALTQVIELEEVQLNFIDRRCTAQELRWLGSIASPQAFVQGWVYDIETDSQNRLEFVEVLNQQKYNRNGAISLQIVKYTDKNGTPLSRYLIAGMDWVIELSQSLAELGKKDIRVWAIANKQDREKAFELIKEYSAFSSILQRSGKSEIQSLTL